MLDELVMVYFRATVSFPAVESLLSSTADRVTPTVAPLSVKVSSEATAVVDALMTNSPVLSSVPLTILYVILIPFPARAGNSFIVVADYVLLISVSCFIALVDIPIPCTSGAAFNSELPSALLKSVLSKKSNTDEHSSLSNCMIGTSLIEPTPSKLFATVLA